MKMDCRFCGLKDDRTRIISEHKYCYAILSNPRLMKGHILIIPKRHVEKLSELNAKERLELFEVLQKYSQKILDLKISKGYSIHMNYMPMLPESKTKVDHLHIHIWPRDKDDEIYMKMLKNQQGLFKDLAEKELKRFKNILK